MHAHAYYVSTTDDPLAARAPHRNNINVLLLLFSLTIAQSRPTAALGQRLRRRTPGWSASARGRTSPVRAAVPLHDAGGSTACAAGPPRTHAVAASALRALQQLASYGSARAATWDPSPVPVKAPPQQHTPIRIRSTTHPPRPRPAVNINWTHQPILIYGREISINWWL